MSKLSSHQLYLSRNNRSINKRLSLKYSMCKAHAAERHISFTLTFDEFKQMWRQQKGRCAYSGQRMTLTVGRGYYWRNWSVSIDRLDPAGSYTRDNVILCRFDANSKKSKRNFFSVEFMETFPEFVANILTLKPSLNTLAA